MTPARHSMDLHAFFWLSEHLEQEVELYGDSDQHLAGMEIAVTLLGAIEAQTRRIGRRKQSVYQCHGDVECLSLHATGAIRAVAVLPSGDESQMDILVENKSVEGGGPLYRFTV
ncbi:hypothetical protein GGX14DRAFT_402691 [Mycena pura]|uniref:Uncharacterized protein n=1 Tax=Mycena pura TaxID=153505 RepID=A0AAD6V528_9AGAR|nr:hypothetical protein GGX14DRAFT_402691 [Mycena pura]